MRTTGKRTAYTVVGLIEFFSGRLFFQGIEGKCNAQRYQTCLEHVLTQTTQPLFLVQDGAKYHHAAALHPFWHAQRGRLFTIRLPSSSPDYTPMECLRRAIKRATTHHHSFPVFDALIDSVEDALAYVASHPARVKARFGRYLDHLTTADASTLGRAA